MKLIPIKTRVMQPPKDDLFSVLEEAELSLKENDIVVIASKVVAIGEGRCVSREGGRAQKDKHIAKESDLYLPRDQVPGEAVIHTITHGQLAVSAGIDPFGEYYVLWPEDPMGSAESICAWLKEKHHLSVLGVIVSDSKSTPFRRGVVGGAIGWAGFSPLYDNRIRTDLTGRRAGGSQINIADAVAAATVLVMGEGNEQTPVVIARDVPYITEGYAPKKDSHNSYVVSPEDDIFAPFFGHNNVGWKKGGRTT